MKKVEEKNVTNLSNLFQKMGEIRGEKILCSLNTYLQVYQGVKIYTAHS